ncbi:MAG: DJ-1/PfpI family protein [Treponema sp.]|jgi:4-methyl-5(b-hydroxyethyl)-thiazole monophosphate biosynthesis|nr:DJ-1/PfpI family protein [Treponema sp.]
MTKKALILLAEGFEEVEALTPIDYLRRAGIEITSAAIGREKTVTGARKVPVNADACLAELARAGKAGADSWDAVILPGGMPGASNLAASKDTGALLKEMAAAHKWVCAICASPALVLAPLGLLAGIKYTCYPGMEKEVPPGPGGGAQWSDDKVVVVSSDKGGGIITSRGPGTAGAFAIAIISALLNEAEAGKVARAVLL